MTSGGQTVGPTTLGPLRLVQHAKIYKYTDFHPNRTGCSFPIGSLPRRPIRTSVTSVGQTVGHTTLGSLRLLISLKRSVYRFSSKSHRGGIPHRVLAMSFPN